MTVKQILSLIAGALAILALVGIFGSAIILLAVAALLLAVANFVP